jgi:hypothetical protein
MHGTGGKHHAVDGNTQTGNALAGGRHMEQEHALNEYDQRRFHERKKYAAEIVFHHANRLYAGSLKDISLGGAYIETYSVNQFCKEDIITLSIPFSSGGNNIKRRGSIKWLNNVGFAVEFI